MNAQSMPSSLRVAVVSDLHVCDSDGKNSFIRVGAADGASKDPIAGLLEKIRADSIRADLLVCPGDLTDRASNAGAQYAWQALHKLKEAFGASQLITTAGNHDMDSRHSGEVDATAILKKLMPMFPIDNLALSNQYWARYFTVLEESSYRIVVLNSCAHHGQAGGPAIQGDEFAHGRVLATTTEDLRRYLAESEARPINILVCHHHPFKYADIYEDDYSEMDGGADLLSVLDSDSSRWLVIHGHKHHARVAYANGGSNAPILFCAGSLSRRLSSQQSMHARNQFYLIEFPFSEFSTLRVSLAAEFRSYDWIYARGWVSAGDRSGLPAHGGLGCHVEAEYLARDIAHVLGNRSYVEWAEVVETFPNLRFVVPQDLTRVHDALTSSGFRILFDRSGNTEAVSR